MKFGLEPPKIKQIKDVLSAHPKIQKVILYGSRAMGTQKNGSDIDLTLLAPDMDTGELLQIETELDELMLPYKIDLSLLHQIDNASLIDHIDRVGVEFC